MGQHAVPRHPWPSWVVGYCGASGGSFFPCWSSSLFWLWLVLLLQALAADIAGRRFRIILRKWSQAHVFFWVVSALVCVFACVLCWQDLTKTAYVVGGGDLLPLLGGLQEELYVQPRGKWHIPP